MTNASLSTGVLLEQQCSVFSRLASRTRRKRSVHVRILLAGIYKSYTNGELHLALCRPLILLAVLLSECCGPLDMALVAQADTELVVRRNAGTRCISRCTLRLSISSLAVAYMVSDGERRRARRA